MSQTEDGQCLKGRIGQQDLLGGTGRRVTFISGDNIGVEHLGNVADAVHKLAGDQIGLFPAAIAFHAALLCLLTGGSHDAGAHFIQQRRGFLQFSGNQRWHKLGAHNAVVINAGIHGAAQQVDEPAHLILHAVAADGAVAGGLMGDGGQILCGGHRIIPQPLLDHR